MSLPVCKQATKIDYQSTAMTNSCTHVHLQRINGKIVSTSISSFEVQTNSDKPILAGALEHFMNDVSLPSKSKSKSKRGNACLKGQISTELKFEERLKTEVKKPLKEQLKNMYRAIAELETQLHDILLYFPTCLTQLLDELTYEFTSEIKLDAESLLCEVQRETDTFYEKKRVHELKCEEILKTSDCTTNTTHKKPIFKKCKLTEKTLEFKILLFTHIANTQIQTTSSMLQEPENNLRAKKYLKLLLTGVTEESLDSLIKFYKIILTLNSLRKEVKEVEDKIKQSSECIMSLRLKKLS